MVSGGFLRQPRVRVLWGSVNLSAYDGDKGFPQGSPLVYDVQVDLNAENQAPTANMKWDPTGPGFAVYESFINDPEYMKTQITIEYFYPRGKKVVFVFVWSGQTINYGNDMTVTVNMTSELAGLINGNIRSTAQAYDEKTGGSPQDLVKRLQKQFGLEEFSKLVQFNKGTLDYWKKVKILNQYGNDWTFGNAVAALNTFTQEHITGMRLVQLFNREEQEYEKFKAINKQHRVANIKSIFYYSVFFPVVEILSSFSIALIIWFAGVKGSAYNINLGDITFFIMMVNMMFRPIRMLADRLNTLQMGFVSAERVFKVLDTDEIISNSGSEVFTGVKNSIEFKDIWFAYKNDHFVLNNVSFKIQAGQTVALVGATGAGKSTIINLLSRFYDYQRGQILIDGLEIRNFELQTIRKNTGVVLQDVYLFNDSILNNITLSNPDIKTEDVIEATKKIGLYEYISSLPGGFQYQVTERGQSLSAGQRQLIAFIRAFVYQPKIFILDEATATIDTQTELLIQQAVEKISEGRTSIIIAHRLSTIKHVDKIFVFDKGEIIEEGSIKELLEKDSQFKKLYELQNKGELIE
jgi:ABC-type multidrug transport system fused ATPase/permease subunit